MEPDTFRERYVTLSTRQRTILLLRCHGRTNAEVARQLFVQEKTVKNHMTRILARMGVRGGRGSTALCAEITAVTGKSR
jgi:two-component system, NarL family, response regulator DevR